MTDLVSQLVGALEGLLHECEQGIATSPHARIEARAALTAAKAGGWVAVPVEMTDEMRDAGNEWVGNRFLLGQAYSAMLAARPLPNPPKEQA